MLKRPFLLALAAVFLSACNLSLAQDVPPPPGYTPPIYQDPATVLENVFPASLPDAAAGAEIYAVRCAPCHGDTGLGDGPQAGQLPVAVAPIGRAALAAENSPAAWFSIITLGNLDSFMPPFGNALSDQERWDVLAYVYSLSQPAQLVTEGEAIFAAECAECHAPADFGDPARLAPLANLELAEVVLAGIPGQMPAYSEQLSVADIEAVTAYMRSITFPPLVVASPLQPAAESPAEETSEAEPQTEVAAEDAESEEANAPEAAATLTLGGQVLHGAGGPLPAGLTVTLYGYDHTTQALTQTATVGADGRFEFSGLENVPQRLFFATTDHMAMTYGSDFVQVVEGTLIYDLPLTVYDATSVTDDLTIARLHIFLEFPEPDLIQIVELLVLDNRGSQTIVPSGPGQVAYSVALPEGAQGLIFQEGALGDRYLPTADGFGDIRPVLPGEGATQLLFAYQLPYDRGLEFRQRLLYPAEAVLVFVPPDTVDLSAERLMDGGLQDLNGLPYQLYAGETYAAGEALELNLRGRHPLAAGGFQLAASTPASLVLGALGLAFTLLGVGLWLRDRRLAGRMEQEETQEELLDAILALEEAYERGEVDEAAFALERAALKARLAELLQG